MNMKRRIWLSMAIAILSATASLAQQVNTGYDLNADFNRYKTYSWGNVHTEHPLWWIESREQSIPRSQQRAGR